MAFKRPPSLTSFYGPRSSSPVRARVRRLRRAAALAAAAAALLLLAARRSGGAGYAGAPPPEGWAADPSLAELPPAPRPLPRVALLFLTRGPMPLERVWRAFLEPGGRPPRGGGWRQLFALHVHPPPDWEYPPGSLFAGAEVPDRVPNVRWGQHSVVEAARRLYAAGLAAEPAATHFVLLDEASVPLYSAPAVWAQLASESRSRVDACGLNVTADEPGGDGAWHPAMGDAGLPAEAWRRSQPWTSLLRRHVEVVVADAAVAAAFARECWSDPPDQARARRFCISDRHYVPSLLAAARLEAQAACAGVAVYSEWPGYGHSPRVFGAADATREALHARLRSWKCDAAGLEEAAAAGVRLFAARWAAGGDQGPGFAAQRAREAEARDGVRALGLPLMRPQCPLFARKVAPDGGAPAAWEALLRPVLRAGRRR